MEVLPAKGADHGGRALALADDNFRETVTVQVARGDVNAAGVGRADRHELTAHLFPVARAEHLDVWTAVHAGPNDQVGLAIAVHVARRHTYSTLERRAVCEEVTQ